MWKVCILLVLITHVYHIARFKERKDCGEYSGYINVFCFCILHNVWNVVRSPHSLNPDGDDFSAYVANCICGRIFPSRTKWNLNTENSKILERYSYIEYSNFSACHAVPLGEMFPGIRKIVLTSPSGAFGMSLSCLTLTLEALWSLERRALLAQQQVVASLKTWIFNNTAVRNWSWIRN
jgi:hypothetical protein